LVLRLRLRGLFSLWLLWFVGLAFLLGGEL
jgi:hypothetical protein